MLWSWDQSKQSLSIIKIYIPLLMFPAPFSEGAAQMGWQRPDLWDGSGQQHNEPLQVLFILFGQHFLQKRELKTGVWTLSTVLDNAKSIPKHKGLFGNQATDPNTHTYMHPSRRLCYGWTFSAKCVCLRPTYSVSLGTIKKSTLSLNFLILKMGKEKPVSTRFS